MENIKERATIYIWAIVPVVLIVFGTIGNVLSIVVLNNSQRSRTSTSTYLSTLAVCDLFVLYCGVARQWGIYTFGFDVRNVHEIICKAHFFAVTFSAQFSSWILVAITIERVISVRKPHIAKKECTKCFARLVLVIEVVSLLILNSHILYGVSRIKTRNNTAVHVRMNFSCEPDTSKDDYTIFMWFVWTWIDTCTVFVVPCVILLVGNVIIIVNIRRSRRFRREVATNRNCVALNTNKPLLSLTAILLTLNSVFFVCVGPVNVYIIGQFYWWPDEQETVMSELIWAIVSNMMYANNAVNFLLYILCGSQFRAEVKCLLLTCSTSRANVPEMTSSSSKQSSRLISTTTSFERSSFSTYS